MKIETFEKAIKLVKEAKRKPDEVNIIYDSSISLVYRMEE